MAADLFEVKCVMRRSSDGSPWTSVSDGRDIIKETKVRLLDWLNEGNLSYLSSSRDGE